MIPKPDSAHTRPDSPPDSIRLSRDAELDWFDRNAFFERNHSTKGASTHKPPPPPPPPIRKSKDSIIWIPNTQRRSSFPEAKPRRAPPAIRLLSSGGKAASEPSSPKVSCTGRVRPKKDKNSKTKPSERKQSKKTQSETSRIRSDRRVKNSGLWTRLRDVFRSGKLKTPPSKAEAPPLKSKLRSRSLRAQQSSMVEPLAEPLALALNRFASGRKSESWIEELKVAIDEVNATKPKHEDIGLWRRRNLEAPKELNCSRDLQAVGPASV
uniref:Uncharacterized protein n=1 Tax=Kalanchoe fedtschenkoi TaxID=63787 RepID=A0A7N1A6Y0_KALFE